MVDAYNRDAFSEQPTFIFSIYLNSWQGVKFSFLLFQDIKEPML